MRKFLVFLLIILFVPLVSALQVSPVSPVVSVVHYSPAIFGLSFFNDANYSVNVIFSDTSFFTFPPSVSLLPNSSVSFNYSILTNDTWVGQRVFVSTLSVFKVSDVLIPSKSFVVNVSCSGFDYSQIPINNVSGVRELMVNDSLVWRNVCPSKVDLHDLGSGFAPVPLGIGASFNVSYNVVKNFSFYIVQSGVVSNFNVIPRSGLLSEHVSDVPLSFRLSSSLPSSTLQVTLLSTNISVDNNVTYPEALIEVRNTDPYTLAHGVNISSDRWTSSFVPNLFDVEYGHPVRVLFNVTPFVDRTNLTNHSYKIILSVKSSNVGSTVKDIDVFVKYQNLDVINIGGTNYTIVMMSINQTIDACRQHRLGVGLYDAGFESCRNLEVVVNTTVIKEVPASYDFTEAQVKSYADSWSTLSGVAQRLENKQNAYLDKQASSNAKVENLSDDLVMFKDYVTARELDRDRVVQNYNLRFWLIFSFSVFLFLSWLVVALLSNIELFDALERAGQ